MSFISVNGLEKSFGKNKILSDISFSIERGETVSVIGPSGAGKSTMLRCLIDLEHVDGGTIVIDDKCLTNNGVYPKDLEREEVCRRVGMVFQGFNLFPHMTVLENLISAPVTVLKMPKVEALKLARERLCEVGLDDKEKSFPSQLSGGQKQRVAIARALMMNPEILLFDEPTSSLDPQLTAEVLSVIKKLALSGKITIIIVTHEMGFAGEVSDKILFMQDKKIIGEGSPNEIFKGNKDIRIRDFVESVLGI